MKVILRKRLSAKWKEYESLNIGTAVSIFMNETK